MKLRAPGSLARRGISIALSVAFLAIGVGIGGGVPRSLHDLASRTGAAADNAEIAAENTSIAVRDTEAVAQIAESVRSQLRSSERMLTTQQEIEGLTSQNLGHSKELAEVIEDIRVALVDLKERLGRLSSLSRKSGTSAERTASSAADLKDTLDRLAARFERVVEESIELNRKANAYEEITP